MRNISKDILIKPEIKISPEKKLIGIPIQTTLAENKTFELWKGFMPRRKEIGNILSTNLFSVEVYDPLLNLTDFTAQTPFTKWAAVEVTDFGVIPPGMKSLTLISGLYAVFIHKGFAKTIDYVFGTWLPGSAYSLDQRPHFAIMGDRYKNGDPDSEEELWIPIKSIV